ncbi:transcriptional regulator [Helicobacter anseris]|uniref:Transcriptional regulator n=1 Tax=Helicobacter anseris TaxID=375926 RepID=A0A3D8JBT4_9HELI|nr:GyrI-like domain-containing protein [Helicobacter anseris]RDU74625.1 transcriptional regulator [Helicobacter anseris]
MQLHKKQSIFDYKKVYSHLYKPKNTPSIIQIPKMKFIAVKGKGDPNIENGEYQQSIGLLYNIAYKIKMSSKKGYFIKNFFDFIVPPLEGFWWQDGVHGVDYQHKEHFRFISAIRMPDFVDMKDFYWALNEAKKDKTKDFSKIRFLSYQEGLCVQCMHLGSYESEIQTVETMHEYANLKGFKLDFNKKRTHHEIYISNPRKTQMHKLKTIIRHPIKIS